MNPGPSQPAKVLHADLVLLREDMSEDARAALLREAAALRPIVGLVTNGVIEAEGASDFDVAFFFVVDSLAHLEDFGTDARYIRFLQGGLASAMRSFGGADVQLWGDFAGVRPYAAVAAVAATPQTYDWQVRDALSGWASGASAAIGLAIGERQRYRGIGIMFSDAPIPRPSAGFDGFGLDFITGRCRILS